MSNKAFSSFLVSVAEGSSIRMIRQSRLSALAISTICLPATVKDPTSVLGSASKPMRSSSSFAFRLISFQLTRLSPLESRPAKMFSAMES